ncbi:CHAT domain-containing protein [Microseira sp. BLCC-F43]|jgi:CHAT domain-containing protein/tetratricopeptide (TPR) repeat protein|uniref:CHAT domain-containing protein n=1 Tax=Microseira sp. BLCC-F43 TaxID=3153602 RepID=UPI0035B8F193
MKQVLRSLFLAILGLILSLSIHAIQPIKAQLPASTQNTALAFVEAGKNHYDAGQFSAAIRTLQQAAQTYEAAGDKIKQAQTLSWLSLAYQKLGQWQAAETAINTSLSLLNSQNGKNEQVRAQVLNAQGRLQLATGKAETALETWRQAEIFYAQARDEVGVLGSQINQAEAMQALGLYRRAEKLFAQIEQKLQAQPDSSLKATGLRNLGKMLRLAGDIDESYRILTLSLAVVQRLPKSPQLESETLLSLGNTERTLAKRSAIFNDEQAGNNYTQKALERYQKAVAIASSPLTRLQAQLNQLSLLIEINQISDAQPLLPPILSQIYTLPASRESVYAAVNFAESLIKLENRQTAIPNFLNAAIQQAESLEDKRAQSYALGTLGKFYEKTQDWSKAKNLTQAALLIAQQLNASDIAYQWQWQLGQILQSNLPTNSEAIAYYKAAVNTLNNLRSDLVSLNPEIQFSFRETVEPVYRELVDLLLRSPTQENLLQARNTIESLQLAELDNFFRDACAKSEPVNIDALDKQAAIIYPIILKNPLEIIVKLPGKDNLHHYTNQGVTEAQVDEAVRELRIALTQRSTSLSEIKAAAKQLYEWLIKPLSADVENFAQPNQKPLKTLVFVLDGSLRNIPPAALYNGKQYLIEQYAVVVTPGLQLINPQPLLRKNIRAILAGAANAPSFEPEGFSPIDNVTVELEAIQKQLDQSEKLENQDFQQEKIQKQINDNPYNVVHIATHGKFSSNLQNTFLLDWNQRINVRDLDNLLRSKNPTQNSIQLLILSACQTALGDKRAALGLAGVAIRAGASSTLATLWHINDASTAEFMTRFYQQLKNPHIPKAEALRNTQIAFLTDYSQTDYNRPYHWAAFTLIGNWL